MLSLKTVFTEMCDITKILWLQQKAKDVWKETLELHAKDQGVRIASCLSCTDLLTVLFYGGFLKFFPHSPLHSDRDRFIASKGHGAIALYPILADLGFFPRKCLEEVGNTNTAFGMIPDPGVPGIETVNGSLGHGLGVGAGIALSLQYAGNNAKTIVLHGDGELGEGAVWEAAAFAGDRKLKNLYLIIDVNKKSMLGNCRRSIGQWQKMFEAFSWTVFCCDGHDISGIYTSLKKMFYSSNETPSVLLLDTIKGHGVPELEQSALSHVMSLKAGRVAELTAEMER